MENFSQFTRYKIILFFACLYVIIDCACNVVLYKIVQVGSLIVPAGIFLYPIIFLLGDIIAEVYGYKIARLIIYYDLFFNLLFAIFVTGLIQLPSPSYWHLEGDYLVVFSDLIRTNISVILAVLVGSIINIYCITRWKTLVKGRYFWLRSIGSSMIGEAIMLILLAFFLYAGRLPSDAIYKLILSDYIIRVAYAVVGVIPASLIISYLKSRGETELHEGNNSLNFNPFANKS